MAHDRKCIIDGKIYEYCPNCGNYNKNETWRLIYCCENCRDVDKSIKQFRSGKIDVSTIKEELLKYGIDTTKGTAYTDPIFKSVFEEKKEDVEVKEVIEVTQSKKINKKNNGKNISEKKEIVNEEVKPITIDVPEVPVVEEVITIADPIVEEVPVVENEVLVDNVVNNLFKF